MILLRVRRGSFGADDLPLAGEEYNPFEATAADMNLRRTTGFLTPDLLTRSSQYPPFPATFHPKTTSAPTSVPATEFLARTMSNTTSNTTSSLVSSPGVKRKRNFKLASKIDSWWSAVSTSFTGGTSKEEKARRPSDHTPPASALTPSPFRTSSQFARLAAPSAALPPLRNAASAHDLSGLKFVPRSPQVVPKGALAPAARVDLGTRLIPPTPVQRNSSASDPESSDAATSKTDSRWRNPHLSLNLGPSFSAMTQPKSPAPPQETRPPPHPRTASSQFTDSSASASNLDSSFFSPPLLPSSLSAASPSMTKHARDQSMSTSWLTPGHSPMWDRTPAPVPAASATQQTLDKPKSQAIADADVKGASSFSMHTVHQHIKLRLATAKENCDKELKKIILGITAHVELELHKELEGPVVSDFEGGHFGDLVGDVDGPYGPYGNYASTFDLDSENEALADVDAGEDGGHTDSDGGTSRPASRTPEGRVPASVPLSRRPSTSARVGGSSGSGSPRRQSISLRKRHLTSAARRPDLTTYSFGRQSKSPSDSANSSRSNSRSRSPLPPHNPSAGSRSPARSNSVNPAHSGDLAQSAFIVLLQEIITVASEILDTPISKLTSMVGGCAEYIQRVQLIGKAWDDNPELQCRGWYVQLLLAVAGLSRVVEWWEAERGFWTFDDADEEDAEPILFVAKPNAEVSSEVRHTGESFPPLDLGASFPPDSAYSPLGIDLGVQAGQAGQFVANKPVVSEDTTKRDAEDLRQAVEQVRSQTLLMELSLDGQLFQYLSSAWQELVGCVLFAFLSLLLAHSTISAAWTPPTAWTHPSPTSFTPTTQQSSQKQLASSKRTTRIPLKSASASASPPPPPPRTMTKRPRTCSR